MVVFVVKGVCKGILRVDNRVRLAVENADKVSKIVLCNNYKNYKIISKEDFNLSINTFVCDSVLLLNNKNENVGKACLNGKINAELIMSLCKNELVKNSVKPVENRYIDNNSGDKVCLEKVEIKDNKENLKANNEFDKNIIETSSPTEDLSYNKNDKEIIIEKILDNSDSDNVNCDELCINNDENIEKGVDFVINAINEKKSKIGFFELIKKDLHNFLSSYPTNEELEQIVFNSRWVSIVGEKNYSVGVIYEDKLPIILAYAVPYSTKSDIEKEKLSMGEWLAIDKNHPENRGYYLYYQDISNGKMLEP